jgi:hypothetical protein
MMTKLPILICIDVEPDYRRPHPTTVADWVGFERTVEFVQSLRPRLEAATGAPVRFSWFLRMDPQIAQIYGSADWAVTRYSQILKNLEAAGDELGLHVHAWRWNQQAQDWVGDLGDQKWVNHCINTAFEAFRSSLGRACRSFRFGDHWLNDEALGLIERSGALYDLTLEPGQSEATFLPDELFTGNFVDCSEIPRIPYRPDKNDFRKPGGRRRRIWMIPVSTASTEWLPHDQCLHQGFVALNPAFVRQVFSGILDAILGVFRDPYVVLVARTDIVIDARQRKNLEQNVEFLLSHPMLPRLRFETPEQLVERFRFNLGSWGKQLGAAVLNRANQPPPAPPLMAELPSAYAADKERMKSRIIEQQEKISALVDAVAERQRAVEMIAADRERVAGEVNKQQQKIESLVALVAERQNAVESLGEQLAERHEKVLALTEHVAERQRAVELLIVQLNESQDQLARLIRDQR